LVPDQGRTNLPWTPIPRLAFSLVLWVWLKAGSIALFARESLHVF
jgi:hypothetical protein